MQLVKIVKIGNVVSVNTQYGEKNKRFYTVRDNMGNSMEVSKFISKDDPLVKEGEEVLMELKRSGKYINCSKIEKLDSVEPEPVEPVEEETVSSDVWDKKDRRICRQNTWRHAVEIVKASLATKREPMEFTEFEICNLCEMVAHQIEADIYRNGSKGE